MGKVIRTCDFLESVDSFIEILKDDKEAITAYAVLLRIKNELLAKAIDDDEITAHSSDSHTVDFH